MYNPPSRAILKKIPDLGSQKSSYNKDIYMVFRLNEIIWYVAEINHSETEMGFPPFTQMNVYVRNYDTEDEWRYISLPELERFEIGNKRVTRDITDANVNKPRKLKYLIELG